MVGPIQNVGYTVGLYTTSVHCFYNIDRIVDFLYSWFTWNKTKIKHVFLIIINTERKIQCILLPWTITVFNIFISLSSNMHLHKSWNYSTHNIPAYTEQGAQETVHCVSIVWTKGTIWSVWGDNNNNNTCQHSFFMSNKTHQNESFTQQQRDRVSVI